MAKDAEILEQVKALLEENGCDCECGGHHWEHHDEDCERCLACRIEMVLRGGQPQVR